MRKWDTKGQREEAQEPNAPVNSQGIENPLPKEWKGCRNELDAIIALGNSRLTHLQQTSSEELKLTPSQSP